MGTATPRHWETGHLCSVRGSTQPGVAVTQTQNQGDLRAGPEPSKCQWSPGFSYLVLASSFLVPARRHRGTLLGGLRGTLQQPEPGNMGKTHAAHSCQAAHFSEPSRSPGAGWDAEGVKVTDPSESWSLLSVSFLPVGWDTDPTCGCCRVACRADHT